MRVYLSFLALLLPLATAQAQSLCHITAGNLSDYYVVKNDQGVTVSQDQYQHVEDVNHEFKRLVANGTCSASGLSCSLVASRLGGYTQVQLGDGTLSENFSNSDEASQLYLRLEYSGACL